MAVRHIFLDMDGVITDFVTPALKLHDRLDVIDTWPPGIWDIPSVLGITSSRFWKTINNGGIDYWSNLPPYPWTEELMRTVRQTAPFTVLSSPSHDPECPAGKVSWLRSHLGSHFRDFLLGHQKFLCAKHDVVLIDDSDHNVEQFRAHGGQAILFPQIWNANHAVQDRLGYINAELLKLLD